MTDEAKTFRFNKSLEGYSVEDVDKYVEQMSGAYVKLAKRCKDSDRKLLFALRKLESLTLELQKNYAEMSENESHAQEEAKKELNEASEKAESIIREAEKIKSASEKQAVDLIRTANAKAGSIVKEAEELREATEKKLADAYEESARIIASSKLRAEAVVSGSAQRARTAAENIVKDAALAARKIIKDAEIKANNACREVLSIYKAAEEMYNEVSAFRGSLFSLYSDHIESIQTITGSAHELVDSVDGIVRNLEDKDGETADMPQSAPTTETRAEPEQTAEPVNQNDEEIPESLRSLETKENISEDENTVTVGDEDDDDALPEPAVFEGEYYDSFDEIPDDTENKEDSDIPEEPGIIEESDESDFSEEIEEIEDFDDSEEPEEPEESEESEEPEETEEPEKPEDSEEQEEIGRQVSSSLEAEIEMIGFRAEFEDKTIDADDFILPDDLWSSTSVLDIVNDLGPEKKKTSEEDDFSDLERMFSSELGVSADEFDRVFSSSNTVRNINEIQNQPLVAPAQPQKTKKHSKFQHKKF